MLGVDYLVFVAYLLGTVCVAVVMSKRNSNTSEMFNAGGQSPWWAAGLSSFMTMFSAGTFVVWGGIAYKHGMVAVTINLCYGIAALLVGRFLAGRWKSLGIRTPAEFIKLRYGRFALHTYVWLMMAFKCIGCGVALYSLCVIATDLMPLAEGNPLRSVSTGNMSVRSAVLLLGGTVVLYTMIGGLWGVLMTDVLQFVILSLAVLFVVPLALSRAGGVANFVHSVPDGFFNPTGGGYTWYFLFGWVAIHYFIVGAEWAYVQRYLCVASPRDARKGAYLFGVLYLVSPLLWMLPPMAYRVIDPLPESGVTPTLTNNLTADQLSSLPPHIAAATRKGDFSGLTIDGIQTLRSAAIQGAAERAYVRVCRDVLPPGMMGMMLAAMFSATASMISSQLNVFSTVLTKDIYMPLRRRVSDLADERLLVWVGRLFTVLLGALIIGIALSVPNLGGAETVIVGMTSFLLGPLLAPMAWGLMSQRVGSSAVWLTLIAAASGLILTRTGVGVSLLALLFVDGYEVQSWISTHQRPVDTTIGVLIPILLLYGLHLSAKANSPGWRRLEQLPKTPPQAVDPQASKSAMLIVASCTSLCGILMMILAIFDSAQRSMLLGFAGTLVALSIALKRQAFSVAREDFSR